MGNSISRLIRVTSPVLCPLAFVLAMTEPAIAANAWTPQCIWDGIPAPDRAVVVTAMSKDGKPAFRLESSKIKGAMEACGVGAVDSVDARRAFAAYGQGLAAMSVLESRYQVGQAQVLAAWDALPNGDRNALVGIARNMRNEPAKMAVLQRAVSDISGRLNLDAGAAPQLRQIVYSLALLERIGRGGLRPG